MDCCFLIPAFIGLLFAYFFFYVFSRKAALLRRAEQDRLGKVNDVARIRDFVA
jgi:hypothetical protein